MLGRSVNSANSSGADLKEIQTSLGSSETTANIFPPILSTRWLPHWICSVVCGNEMQNSRTESVVMCDRTAGGSRWGSRVVCCCASDWRLYLLWSRPELAFGQFRPTA